MVHHEIKPTPHDLAALLGRGLRPFFLRDFSALDGLSGFFLAQRRNGADHHAGGGIGNLDPLVRRDPVTIDIAFLTKQALIGQKIGQES